MKQLLLLFVCGGLLFTGCDKIKNEVSKHTMTFDDIAGTYHGTTYEDRPLPTGGSSSTLYPDTVSVKMAGSDIVLTSPVMGTVRGSTGSVTDTTYEVKIPEQQNGKTDSSSGKPVIAAEGSSSLIFEKSGTSKSIIKGRTIGKDPNTSPNYCYTRYRVVSLEK